MDATGVVPDRAKEGQRRLATTAAVFWFQAVGALAIGALVVLSPLSCYGDPAPGYEGPGPCPGGVPSLFTNGTLLLWTFVLGATAAVAVGAWFATRVRPLARAMTFSLLGFLAVVPIVLVAIPGGLGAVVPFLWTGIPAILLLGSWLPVLARGTGERGTTSPEEPPRAR